MPARPIIIAAVPRSGSSLIASIFAAHGVWVGRHPLKTNMQNTPVPYRSFENEDIDQWFKTRSRPLKTLVRDLVPADSPWLYKCSPVKARVILDALEQWLPVCVRVHRSLRSIIRSSARGKARRRRNEVAQLANLPGPVVDADAVIARDFTTLVAAFEICGVVFDPVLAESVINDELWHYRSC